MSQALQKYRVKGDYFQERVLSLDGPDNWIDTDIRAAPYKASQLERLWTREFNRPYE